MAMHIRESDPGSGGTRKCHLPIQSNVCCNFTWSAMATLDFITSPSALMGCRPAVPSVSTSPISSCSSARGDAGVDLGCPDRSDQPPDWRCQSRCRMCEIDEPTNIVAVTWLRLEGHSPLGVATSHREADSHDIAAFRIDLPHLQHPTAPIHLARHDVR